MASQRKGESREDYLARVRASNAANSERYGLARRVKYAANPEKGRETSRRYRESHKDTQKEFWRAWRASHLEQIRADASKRRKADPMREREMGRISYAANASKMRKYFVDYRKANPLKGQAKGAVSAAIQSGRLVVPTLCSSCGQPALPAINGHRTIQAHHYLGYEPEHRLDVVWLCAPCHSRADHARLEGEHDR